MTPTPADLADVAARLRAGSTLTAEWRALVPRFPAMSYPALRRAMIEAKLPTKRGGAALGLSARDLAIASLAGQGWSLRRIGAEVGLTAPAVRVILARVRAREGFSAITLPA